MSRYMVNKLMWEVDGSDQALAAFRSDPGGFIDVWEERGRHPVPPYPSGGVLRPEERSALERMDLGALYAMGVSPFLLWQLSRSLLVPDRMRIDELSVAFRAAVEPHGYPDFFT